MSINEKILTERHLGEELFRKQNRMRQWIFEGSAEENTYMMDNVEVRDIVEKKTALPSKKVPVDGCSRSTLEVPFLATVVW